MNERDGCIGRNGQFRQSERILTFVLLRAEGWLEEADLAGLRDDTLTLIREGCARRQRDVGPYARSPHHSPPNRAAIRRKPSGG